MFNQWIVFSTSDEEYNAYADPEICQYSCKASEDIGENDVAERDWAEDAVCDSSFERSADKEMNLLSIVASFFWKKQERARNACD